MTRLAGKVALVTGAGQGIGRAVALRFAAEGAAVIAAGPSDTVDHVADEGGGHITPMRCDVSRPDEVDALINAVAARFGRLDVLCNNAGIFGASQRLHELDLAVWDRVQSVNLRGAFLVLKAALGLMLRSGGGAIINMASIGVDHPSAGLGAYLVTKAGMLMLTKQAAIEYARDNIRVNCVAPGAILTPAMAAVGPDVLRAKESITPNGRIGTPEEVAAVCLFLASDEAAYVTGACYTVAGGREAQ